MKLQITSTQKWIITFTVMLVTIIEILDMTIVNVALPPMMSTFGANADQITWVLTSYIVSAAIVMPLTGFLVTRFGRKKLLMVNIVGFMLSSILCGMSVSLAQMVLFRILQGIFGASLVPLSQYILTSIFSKKDQSKAMAIWGIGIMIAPVLGPILGGYITSSLTWRWIFYVNIPVCLLAFFLTLQFIPETITKIEKIDWIGLILLALGIGCLQIFLDRGNVSDWFNSKFIVILCIIWIFAIAALITHCIKEKNSIININVFKNRNFSAATITLTVFCFGLFSTVAMMPILLEKLMGYSAQLAGLMLAPRATASAIGMAVAAIIMRRGYSRTLMVIGLILTAYSSYWLATYNLQFSFYSMTLPNALGGFGSGLFFVPLSTAALATLSKEDAAEGAGLFNFGRSLGGSIGISVISTLITRESQINWNRLSGHIYSANVHFKNWLTIQHLKATSTIALNTITNEVARQSLIIAFLDSYWFVAISLLLMIPLVMLIKNNTE